MPSAPPAPPLSLRGIYEALRVPTWADLVFSLKAYAAATLALLAGFSQNLVNPYWAVLTIYIVLAPPGSGVIRSKSLFRLIGTVGGGLLILALTGLFGDQLGVLACVTIGVVVGLLFLQQIDRTPANYIWFSGGITAAVIGLTNLMQPTNMFEYATARMGESCVGILAIFAMDSLFYPRAMTPEFVRSLEGWCGDVRTWTVRALDVAMPDPFTEAGNAEVRQGLRNLAKAVALIDGKAVQLPFDVVRRAPRRRQLNLIRRQVVELIADLTALMFWTRSLRGGGSGGGDGGCSGDTVFAGLLAAFRDWAKPGAPGEMDAAAADGLRARLEAARAELDPAAGDAVLVERGLLARMVAFLRDWSDLAAAMESLRNGAALPPALDRVARTARPVRSVDYLVAACDVAPLLLSMSFSLTLWYVTAWVSGAGALLFSFVGCVFLIGQGRTLQAGSGVFVLVLTAFTLVFIYQFAVLPRVTDFPVLIAVLACAMIPLGLLLSMSMAGLLVSVFVFAFLGLQDTYAGDFETSLQTLAASLAGLLIALASLYVCGYGKTRLAAHRLAMAVRRDILDLARARRTPDRQRFLFLEVDRLSLLFTALQELSAGDIAPPRLRMLDDFAVGFNLLTLREEEPLISAKVREVVRGIRAAAASRYRLKLAGRQDDGALATLVGQALRDQAVWAEPERDRLLHALTGMRLALATTAPAAAP